MSNCLFFCFYCGQIRHNEKLCAKRKKDLIQNCVRNDQYGYCLRARSRKSEWIGYKGSEIGRESGE